MSDERHGIEVEIDSRGASAGEQRVVRSLENIKKKTNEVGQQGYVAADRANSGFRSWSETVGKTGRTMDNIRAKARAAGDASASAAQRAQAAWNNATGSIDRNVAAAARLHPTMRQIEQSMGRVSRQRPFDTATQSATQMHASLLSVRNLLVGIGAITASREIAQTEVQFRGSTRRCGSSLAAKRRPIRSSRSPLTWPTRSASVCAM